MFDNDLQVSEKLTWSNCIEFCDTKKMYQEFLISTKG